MSLLKIIRQNAAKAVLPFAALSIAAISIIGSNITPQNLEARVQQQSPQVVSAEVVSSSENDQYDVTKNSLSSFGVGNYVVGLILPKGNIAWTEAAKQRVITNLESAFSYLKEQLPSPGHLNFSYVIFEPDIGVEPINYSTEDRMIWISEVLEFYGYASTTDMAHDLRQQNRTDFAVLAFVANAEQDADGKYPNSPRPVDEATISSLYTLLTSRTPLNVYKHAFFHIFGAEDEYAEADKSCAVREGYLGIPNANSEKGGEGCNAVLVPCIMRSRVEDVCHYTLGQAGMKDGEIVIGSSGIPALINSNGIPDAVDIAPTIELGDIAVTTPYATIRVIIYTNPVTPGISYIRPVSINRINKIYARIADGGMQALTIPQGRKRIELKLGIEGLVRGETTLELIVRTQFGNEAAGTAAITYVPATPTPVPAPTPTPPPVATPVPQQQHKAYIPAVFNQYRIN